MIEKLFELAAKVSTAWSLAAFAIAAIVAIVSLISKARGKNAAIAWGAFGVIVILATTTILAPAYLSAHGVYRVRVNVVDEQSVPLDGAILKSSLGGETKQFFGGWEFDIPAASKPADGKLIISGTKQTAFLTGRTELTLGNDFFPTTTVVLIKGSSAQVKGIVVDVHTQPIEGVVVGVFGFDSESIKTGPTGTFTLAAHSADGQQVRLYAQKTHFGSTTQWCQAGDFPVTIILKRQ